MSRSHEVAPTAPERTVAQEALETFTTAMESYFHDPDLRELIVSVADERNEVTLEEDRFATEESFMRAAQAALNFRAGKGRDALEARKFK